MNSQVSPDKFAELEAWAAPNRSGFTLPFTPIRSGPFEEASLSVGMAATDGSFKEPGCLRCWKEL